MVRRRATSYDSVVSTDCCVAHCIYCVLGSVSCRMSEIVTLGSTHITDNIVRETKEEKQVNIFLSFDLYSEEVISWNPSGKS